MDEAEPDVIERVVCSRAFRQLGMQSREVAGASLAVVDPMRHPLRVWRRCSDAPTGYSAAARALGAAVFTNGPMMGKRVFPGVKVTRARVAVELAGALLAGGALGGLAGAVLGGAISAARSFRHWEPCGFIAGAGEGCTRRRSFDGESARHSWIGRTGVPFGTYAVGYGDLPEDVVEGVGGLLLLVAGGRVVSGPGAGADLDALGDKPGVAAWGLVPLGESGASADGGGAAARPAGVLAVLGSPRMTAAAAAGLLAGLGADAAVGTDQRGAVMLGVGATCVIRPPWHRQAMQDYGLCCG